MKSQSDYDKQMIGKDLSVSRPRRLTMEERGTLARDVFDIVFHEWESCHPFNRPAELLVLPADTDLVFATPAEFMAHHHNISVREATERLYRYSPQRHWLAEMMRSGARLIKKEEFA